MILSLHQCYCVDVYPLFFFMSLLSALLGILGVDVICSLMLKCERSLGTTANLTKRQEEKRAKSQPLRVIRESLHSV